METVLTQATVHPADGATPQLTPTCDPDILESAAASRPLPSTDEALAGCQFQECLGRTAVGETWAVRTPDGRDRQVHFLFGFHVAEDAAKDDALARLRALRHDALEPTEFAGGDNRLALITDGQATTLADRLHKYRKAGLPGVPRVELLARLGEAAAALDDLYRTYGLRHLGLTPGRLALKNGRARLLHFGVVELIHAPAGRPAAALNPRYSAPELFDGIFHPSCDVYALGLIYYELLTGAFPFPGAVRKQMAASRRRDRPDLGLAPTADRAALSRALDPDPNRRFSSCAELIAALESRSPARPGVGPDAATPVVRGAAAGPATQAVMRRAVNRLVVEAAADLEVREYQNIRYLLRPGRSIEHRFFTRLPPGTAGLRMGGFRQQWHAGEVRADEHGFTLLAPITGGVWQRLMGTRPGLTVRVDLPSRGAGPTEVRVRVEPAHCAKDLAVRLLEETGPILLESLRTYFQALRGRRGQERLPLDRAFQVVPVFPDQREGEALAAQCKDIAMRGMGLYMDCRPPSTRLRIRLPGDAPGQDVFVTAAVVRAQAREDGRYEVGVRFLSEEGA